MTQSSALPLGAGRAVSGPARRRPLLSPADRLDQLSSRLDDLIRDLRFSPKTSHHETERRIAEAENIAGEIRAVFRAPSKGNPPLWQNGGRALW